MTLEEYLSKEGNTQKRLAEAITSVGTRVTQGGISQWLKDGIPAERVLQIEKATDGQVTRYELRPDLYPPDEKIAV